MGKKANIQQAGDKALEEGIRKFLVSRGHEMDHTIPKKIGRFILTLTSVEPEIPLAGKKLRDLSAKQRALFQADVYEGSENAEFLANWFDGHGSCFVFSKRTVKVVARELVKPGVVHKTISRLCHERPDPVIPYEKLAMAVPRFVKDMQGKMKYLSIDGNYKFENAEEPGEGVWVRTTPINTLLAVLDHQDVHIHRGRDYIVIYNRWFGLYCGGE